MVKYEFIMTDLNKQNRKQMIVEQILAELHNKHLEYVYHEGEPFLDAAQNAQLFTNTERYYRVMYYGSRASWNIRDSNMFDAVLPLQSDEYIWIDQTRALTPLSTVQLEGLPDTYPFGI